MFVKLSAYSSVTKVTLDNFETLYSDQSAENLVAGIEGHRHIESAK